MFVGSRGIARFIVGASNSGMMCYNTTPSELLASVLATFPILLSISELPCSNNYEFVKL